jgi:hypothetical protein
MRNRTAFSFVLILSLGGAAAAAQEIPNWPAPPFWEPPGRTAAPGASGERLRGTLAAPNPLPFIPITPCRVVDTRGLGQTGSFGPPTLDADSIRVIPIASHPVCTEIPPNVGAYSLNITVTNTGAHPFGYIKVWPSGSFEPNVSTLNWSTAGQTIANAAIVPAGGGGAIVVRAGNASTDLIIDINGYYAVAPGISNTRFGSEALDAVTTGSDNTAFGFRALTSVTTSEGNTAVGTSALFANTGNENTALGVGAGAAVTSGSENTFLGYGAGFQITTGMGNIVIGRSAGAAIQTGSHNILIGSNGSANESNTIRIGDTANQNNTVIVGIAGQTAVGGVPVLVTGGGRLGTTTSSRRFKTDIRDMGSESDGLMKLRPVVFRYKEEIDPTSLTQYGLIAEEVADVYPALVANGSDGKPEAIRYQEMNALLLNELQKQRREIAELRSQLTQVQRRLKQK